MNKINIKSRRERGQSLVEAALALPIIIMLMLGLLDLGRAFYILVEVNDAADEGASYASLDYSDLTGIQNRVVDSANAVAIDPANVILTGPTVSAIGQPITVTVSVDMALFTPFVSQLTGSDVLNLRGRATHPIITVP
jgi:Flp pilus assembly protein TadG